MDLIRSVGLAASCEHWSRREPAAAPGLTRLADKERAVAAALLRENLNAADRLEVIGGACSVANWRELNGTTEMDWGALGAAANKAVIEIGSLSGLLTGSATAIAAMRRARAAKAKLMDVEAVWERQGKCARLRVFYDSPTHDGVSIRVRVLSPGVFLADMSAYVMDRGHIVGADFGERRQVLESGAHLPITEAGDERPRVLFLVNLWGERSSASVEVTVRSRATGRRLERRVLSISPRG